MKRTLLFFTCMLASMTMLAQGSYVEDSDFEYLPFVKEGKKWNVIRSDFYGGYHFDQFTLMNEATVKDGKTYMKMHRSEDDLTVTYDAGLLREEDRKVYFCNSDMQNEFLVFDYSLKAGDTYETYSYDEQKVVSYKVLSVNDCTEGPKIVRYNYDQVADSMTTQYRYLRKWTVRRTDNDLEKTWIEGVGSLEGPLANLYDERPVSTMDYLAYVEFVGEEAFSNPYLPFTFYDTLNRRVHGCNMSSGATGYSGNNSYEQFTYELEGNRLHVYGQRVSTLCNKYVYIKEVPTDDPLLRKLHFEEREIEPIPTGIGLRTLDFYVPGFDPNMNYIVVDNNGEEHPVINKTPQMAYRPFVEEGKVWKVGTSTTIVDNSVQVVDYYYFDGDTIIGGKTCKQMMCQRYVSPDYSNEYWTPRPYLTKVGAWYEEDKKVYSFDERQQTMTLKYDFSLEANDTLHFLNVDGYPPFIIGPKQTGGIEGFKGVYRDIMMCRDEGQNIRNTTWLEGVGGLDAPFRNAYDPRADRMPEFLMSCTVGDEVIYLNDEYEDEATPEKSNAPKQRLDFTHIIKTKPHAPMMRTAEQPLYGEYNDLQLGINLDPLAEAYLVRITNESGKAVYEKAINAGNIVALSIDISAYPKGRYTVTIENSSETFTGQIETEMTGIAAITNHKEAIRTGIYNLQGQRISTLQRGLNIVNGRKVYIK